MPGTLWLHTNGAEVNMNASVESQSVPVVREDPYSLESIP
jgi:hypothetical protein